MLEGKLENGFEYKIEEEVLDDFGIMEAFEDIDEKPQNVIKAAKIILGEDQYKGLKKVCTENGRVRTSLMIQSITELFEKAKPVKN